MKIRKIKESDNAFLAQMIREVFEEHEAPREGTVYTDKTTDSLYEVFQIEKAVFWIAESEHEILGCCGIYPTEGLPKGCAELVKFYLPKSARGKGIGKRLMEKSLESAGAFGYSALYIESLPVFSKAVGIYEKLGFIKLSTPLGETGHTGCDIWMLKKLV